MLSLITAALLAAAPGDLEWELPTSLSAPEPAAAAGGPTSAFGVHLGFMKHPDADDSTVFYGLHFRIGLVEWLSLEASVDFAESDFDDGDTELSVVPVQVSAIIKPFQGIPILPYGVAGIGWYFLDVDSTLDEDSSDVFGVHLGAGAELPLGDAFMLHADFRWIFMGEPDWDDPAFDDSDVDYWQVMIGASFMF
jgi:opacity protein-like surface antigen